MHARTSGTGADRAETCRRSRPTIHLAQRERTGGDNYLLVECRAGVAAGWWMRRGQALRLMGGVN